MAHVCDMPGLVSDSDASASDSEPSALVPPPDIAGARDVAGSVRGVAAPAAVCASGAQSQNSRPSAFPGRVYHEFDSFPTANMQECCICLTTPSGGRLCQLLCSHVFHAGCIDTWLTDNNTCPTCRNTVDPLRVMPAPQDSLPPAFPRNFMEMFFAMANPFAGVSAAPSPAPAQPSPPDERQLLAAADTLTSYLRGRLHVSASSAMPLERLANVREIWSSLPQCTSLRQMIDSRPDLFHVVRQGTASAVYVDPHPVSSASEHLSQCLAAISSYLESRGHTSLPTAVPLSVLCDVPAIRRSLPSSMTLSNVIRSRPDFVLTHSQRGSAVFWHPPPSSASAASSAPSASSTLPAGTTRAASGSSRGAGAAATAPETLNRSWETYALAVHRYLRDCGFTSPDTSLSLRLLGNIDHLRALRDGSFPPLSQLLPRFHRLLRVDSSDGRLRVWAITGLCQLHLAPLLSSHAHSRTRRNIQQL